MANTGTGDHPVAPVEVKDTIYGYSNCQSPNAKWLCVDEIYEKMHRPGLYDIGGDMEDFWFMFKTERSVNINLLHIFISSRHEVSLTVSLSNSSLLNIDKKNNIAKLTSSMNQYIIDKYDNKPAETTHGDFKYSYITTYAFSDLDMDLLKNKKLYVSVKVSLVVNTMKYQPFIDEIKANHDLGSLLDKPFEPDYTIESSDGEKFHVHKKVLAANSKVFEAMFSEDNHNFYNESDHMVQDVEKDDLYGFLQFMYTGTVKDLYNCNPLTLVQLSDKYEVNGLRELAEAMLLQKLDVDNALNILVWSDLYNSTSLKLAAMKFIKKHKEILTFKEFKEINNDLIQELTTFILL